MAETKKVNWKGRGGWFSLGAAIAELIRVIVESFGG